jgi:hypothetical protein
LRLRFKAASYIDGPTTAIANLVRCRGYGVRVAIEGLEDLVGLDRYVSSFAPEVASIGTPLTRLFASGRELDYAEKLLNHARGLGMRIAADSVTTLGGYLSLITLGYSEFTGPAIGELMPLPTSRVSSATA